MAIELTDDGTLDTVLRCTECGEEFRYSFDGNHADDCEDESGECGCYDAFVEWAIEDAESEHDCTAEPTEPEDEPEPEPDEDDITTGDHLKFYQSGKLVIEGRVKRNAFEPDRFYLNTSKGQRIIDTDDYRVAVRAYMNIEQYWPNVWCISDHGNAHLIDLTEDK